jgi:hypothetical protein
VHQVPARRAFEEGVDDLGGGDTREPMHCLEKRRT